MNDPDGPAPPAGPPPIPSLNAHNHQVELTGKWVGDDDHKHFEASGVEHKGICE